MKLKERLIIRGSVKLFADDELVYEGDNLVTLAGRQMLIDTLLTDGGELNDAVIRYIAIGDGVNPSPAAGDTALGNEVVRVQAERLHTNQVGSVAFVGFFAVPQVHITEFGLFGSPTATAVKGSGIMFNRAPLTFNNLSGASDVSIHAQIVLAAG